MPASTEKPDVTGEMLGLAFGPAMNAGWWLVAIAITSGTNLLDFFAAAQPNAGRTTFFAVATAIRVVLVFWLGYALIRRMAGTARPGAIGWAFGRFSLFMVALVLLTGGLTVVGAELAGLRADRPLAGVVAFVLVTIVMLLLVRLFAWQGALAVGDRSLGLGGAWRALRGVTGGLVAAYLVVAFVAALHATLTRIALANRDSPEALVGLALADGLVSAVQLALSCALSVVAWRLATARALREGGAVA